MDLPEVRQSSVGDFVKLGDGDSIVGVLRGDAVRFRQEGWGKDKLCYPEAYQGKSTFKFRLNMVEKETLEIKILEMGITVYSQIKELQESGYVLEKTWLKITRRGEKTNTEYGVTPIPDFHIHPEVLLKIKDYNLHDLKVTYVVQDEAVTKVVTEVMESQQIPF